MNTVNNKKSCLSIHYRPLGIKAVIAAISSRPLKGLQQTGRQQPSRNGA